MLEFLNILKDLGSASLSVFWFPVTLWTILGIALAAIMKYSDRIHAIYHYHIRVALLIALPVGLLTSYTSSKLMTFFSVNEAIPEKFIIVQSPITVAASEFSLTVSWSDPSLWLGIAITVFALGALSCLVKMSYDFIALRRFSHSLDKTVLKNLDVVSPSNLQLIGNLRSIPEIAFTDKAMVPFTYGWLSTTIVIPEDMKHDTAKLNMALRHELMHIRHQDYLLNNLLMMIKAVFWFHPLVHHLYSDLIEYREITCDSEVLTDATISKKGYAELLFELATRTVFPNSRTVSMAVNSSTLKKRIEVMKNQTYSSKMFRSSLKLALVATLSITGIIACSDMQSSGITKQDVEEMQASINTSQAENQPMYVINGERMDVSESGDVISRIKSEYIEAIEVIKGQSAVDKYGEDGKNGVIQIQLVDKEQAFSDLLPAPPSNDRFKADKEDYFVVVEDMPELIGGLASIQQKVNYPQEARDAGIEGRVIVQFIVNEQGLVENPKVIKGIGGGADEEALRAVQQAEFKPGMQKGQPVRVQYSLPIIFRLSEGSTIQNASPSATTGNMEVVGKKLNINDLSMSPSGTISGVVTDAGSGEPLAGANITIKSTNRGSATDDNGKFVLTNVPKGQQELEISYIGYNRSVLNINVK